MMRHHKTIDDFRASLAMWRRDSSSAGRGYFERLKAIGISRGFAALKDEQFEPAPKSKPKTPAKKSVEHEETMSISELRELIKTLERKRREEEDDEDEEEDAEGDAEGNDMSPEQTRALAAMGGAKPAADAGILGCADVARCREHLARRNRQAGR